jgi:hypothetical protein
MSGAYARTLDPARLVTLHVEFTTDHREVVDYAVILTFEHEGAQETIRVYDGAHGHNDMHRYTRTGGKQAAEVFEAGSLGQGLRAAIAHCKDGYDEIIRGWHR